MSDRDFSNEKWVEVYRLAVLERRRTLIADRISEALSEISKRMENLNKLPGSHNDERLALQEAINNLCRLDLERARYEQRLRDKHLP
jgi:RNase H-fold protein (predicted Holliday junction resolvase)